MASHVDARTAASDAAQRSSHFRRQAALSAHERHTRLISDYQKYYCGGANVEVETAKLQQTDFDALRQGHRFLRSGDDDADASWAARLAKRYYDRLFREYAIADLSRYKEFKVGFRWRTQAEVMTGIGQFVCGAKGCDHTDGLVSYEVNFAYVEAGVRKQALVKLRVCPSCAYKLNYKKEKAFAKAERKAQRKRAREAGSEDDAGAAKASSAEKVGGLETGLLTSQRQRISEGEFAGSKAVDLAGSAGSGKPTHDNNVIEYDGSAAVAPPPSRSGITHTSADAAAAAAIHGGSVMSGSDAVWESKVVLQEPTVEEDMDAYLETMFA